MGVMEAIAIWLGVLLVFSAVLGKALYLADRRATAREEDNRVQRRGILTRVSA
jgi:hypothetical protein